MLRSVDSFSVVAAAEAEEIGGELLREPSEVFRGEHRWYFYEAVVTEVFGEDLIDFLFEGFVVDE